MPIGDPDYIDPCAVRVELHFTLTMSERLAEAARPALLMLVAGIMGREETADDLPGLIGQLFDLSIDPLAQLYELQTHLFGDEADDFRTFNLEVPGPPLFKLDVDKLREMLVDEEGLAECCSEPGGALIDDLLTYGKDAIAEPEGHTLVLDVHTFDSDPDMVLVRVLLAGNGDVPGLSLSNYSTKWDELAPSDITDEPTFEQALETLNAVVDEANRVLFVARARGL